MIIVKTNNLSCNECYNQEIPASSCSNCIAYLLNILAPYLIILSLSSCAYRAAQQSVAFKGADCTALEHADSDSRALSINGLCESTFINVEPGHYDLSLKLRGEDLAGDLSSILDIKLRVFDAKYNELTVSANFLNKQIDASYLTATIKSPVKSELLNSVDFFTVTLLARHYPADTLWLPERSRFLKIDISYKGAGKLWIKDLLVKRSKWNQTLKQRVSDRLKLTKLSEKLNAPNVALLSQGPQDKQYAWLRDAIKSTQADTIILELSPASFNASELSSSTSQMIELLNLSSKSWGIAYHPYWKTELQIGSGDFRFSSQKQLSEINERLAKFYKLGASVLMIRADDIVPHLKSGRFDYALQHQADKTRFKTLAQAHAYLLNKIIERAPRTLKTYFVPPWYNTYFLNSSPILAGQYFEQLDLLLPQRVSLVWTGPSVRSQSIDALEIEGFRSIVRGRPLALWDNTIYARRHKDFWLNTASPDYLERLNLLSYLEPYDLKIPDYYLSNVMPGEDLVLINGSLNPLNLLQIESAVGFYKDRLNYNPETAIYQILIRDYGESKAKQIIDLDNNYWIAFQRFETELRSVGKQAVTECQECIKLKEQLLKLMSEKSRL